jgi:hypothetical protein
MFFLSYTRSNQVGFPVRRHQNLTHEKINPQPDRQTVRFLATTSESSEGTVKSHVRNPFVTCAAHWRFYCENWQRRVTSHTNSLLVTKEGFPRERVALLANSLPVNWQCNFLFTFLRYLAVLRIRIRICRIHVFLGLLDLFPSIIKQK